LTCIAEEIVDICTIINPEAAQLEYRWTQNPREYLRASVRRRRPRTPIGEDGGENSSGRGSIKDSDETKIDHWKQIIVENYNHVRDLLARGIGVDRLPLSCRDDFVTRLPLLSSEEDFSWHDPSSFWSLVFVWQTLCNSFQEGHRSNAISTRNEMLVAAAIANKKGPLNLPVQLSDLTRSDRDAITFYESQAQTEWIAFGMNPIWDFQFLIHATSAHERLDHFSAMMVQARARFDDIAAAATAFHAGAAKTTNGVEVEGMIEPPKKGAWFDDSMW
jgi:hypothetical protein